MDNSAPLLPFGLAVIAIAGLFILIPFLRGKSDLITVWNTLLFGMIPFIGLASLEVHYVNGFVGFPQLSWFQPTAKEVSWFMLANAVYIATLILAYYVNKPAIKFSQNRLRKWPEVTAPVTFFILAYCCFIMVLSAVCKRATFFGPITSQLALMAAPAASVFSFRLWYRNRMNILWLLLFISVFFGTAFYAMLEFGGRRLILSVFLGPILYVYAVQMRHWKRTRIIVAMGLAVVFVLGVSVVYSKFRYFNETGEARTAKGVADQLRGLGEKGELFKALVSDPLEYFAQSASHYSLLTQRFVAEGVLPAVPLNTVKFLVCYPIPRRLWADKPEVLGVTITREGIHFPSTNWGCGIAGHGAYEGGIPALILYAILVAFGARFMGEPLRLQPENPFLVFMLAAAVPNLMAISRGDLGVMTVQVGQAVLTAIILGWVCRLVFGTSRAVPASAEMRPVGNPPRWVVPHPRINP